MMSTHLFSRKAGPNDGLDALSLRPLILWTFMTQIRHAYQFRTNHLSTISQQTPPSNYLFTGAGDRMDAHFAKQAPGTGESAHPRL